MASRAGRPRLVFMGTPSEAVPALRALTEVTDVALAVTRPDRPRGRSGRLQPPPVKMAALELGVPVAQPDSHDALGAVVEEIAPDVAIVVAYGRLILPELLEVPTHGFVNVHFSLLPRWRGASPVVRAILAGDEATGVTLMRMDEGLDTGPVFASRRVDIEPDVDAGGLTERLAEEGADLLVASLPGYLEGRLVPTPQDHAKATAAAKVRPEEAHVDPIRHSVDAVRRAVRAFNPKPGAWALLDGERFKIWRVAPGGGAEVEPGRVEPIAGRVMLGVKDGVVELLEVQPASKPAMSAAAWMNGRRGGAALLN